MKFAQYLEEKISKALDEPEGKAKRQAKRLGLKHVGFNRYADDDGNITHISVKGVLKAKMSGKDVGQVKRDQKPKPDKIGKDGKKRPKDPVKEKDKKDRLMKFKEYSDNVDEVGENTKSFFETKEKEADTLHKALTKFFHPKSFTQAEILALQHYTANHDEILDSSGDGTAQSPESQHLDSAMSRAQIPFECTVYCGLPEGLEVEEGQDIEIPSFLPTTLSFQVAKEHSDGGVVEITVPKGTNGIYLEAFSLKQGEKELLLDKGKTIKIISEKMIPNLDWSDHEKSRIGDGEQVGDPDDFVLYTAEIAESLNKDTGEEDATQGRNTASRKRQSGRGTKPL